MSFATAIYRHRILLRTDDHFPVKCQLNQFQFIVSCISTDITRDRQFRLQSFINHEFILVLKVSLTFPLVVKSLLAGILVQANGTWLTAKLKSTHSVLSDNYYVNKL